MPADADPQAVQNYFQVDEPQLRSVVRQLYRQLKPWVNDEVARYVDDQ